MKHTRFSLKYMLLTCRLDMLWLPVAFLGLFLVLAWMLQDEPAGFAVTCAFFGAGLPLIAGILAAYAVLEDPALELHFAAPRPAGVMLAERMGMLLVLSTVCALLYQVGLALLGIDLTPLGNVGARQLTWLAPTLLMLGLGAAVAFANRQSVAGAAVIGLVWIVQLVIRDWFLGNPVARYLLLVMGSNYPDNPALRGNQLALLGLALLLLLAAWALLRRQERYI